MKKLGLSIIFAAICMTRSWAGDEPPTIESNKKIYTIYTGVKTNFHPPRWPVRGDWVRVRYIIDRKGYYRAYDIYID